MFWKAKMVTADLVSMNMCRSIWRTWTV